MNKLLILFSLVIVSCAKPPEEISIFFEREEDLGNLALFLMDASGVRCYRLPDFSLVSSVKISNPEGLFFHNDSLFIHNSHLFFYDVEDGSKERLQKIPPLTFAVVPVNRSRYFLTDKGIFYNDEVILEDSILKYREDPDDIWLLTPNSLIAVRKKTQEKRSIELEYPITFCVGPFGLRIYVLYQDRIDVYEGARLSFVNSIPLETRPKAIVTTPAGNKSYILSNTLYVLNRTTHSVERRLPLPAEPLALHLSEDGAYSMIVLVDRLLILDAGRDIIVKEIWLSPVIDIKTSPLSSRIYVLTDEGVAIIRSDSLTVERFIELKADRLFLPGFVLKENLKEKLVPPVVREKTVQIATIQVSSGRDRKSAEQLIDKLILAGYPAYLISGDGWFRVRAGAFRERKDALLIAQKIDRLTREKSWIIKTEINLRKLPVIRTRDLNNNGYMEEVAIEDGDIVIFELKNGIYERVYTITGFLQKYSGCPEFKDFDGDGRLEIVTATPNPNIYSVIEYRDKRWVEEMKHR